MARTRTRSTATATASAAVHQNIVAIESGRDLATMPLDQALEVYAVNFAAVLPPNVSVDHFKRMAVTAVNANQELMGGDRRTLFNALSKCASDGLMPDGREAALVLFRKTKIKNRFGQEEEIDAVQYMPMIAGIRKRLENSGKIVSAEAHVVHKGDLFRWSLGDNAYIEHQPAPLDKDPGELIGAYAIIKMANGGIVRDVMRWSEIERSRSMSRASGGLMWTKFPEQAACKTVLRRCAKGAPQEAAMLELLLARDDEPPQPALPGEDRQLVIPPRPRVQDFVGDETSPKKRASGDDRQEGSSAGSERGSARSSTESPAGESGIQPAETVEAGRQRAEPPPTFAKKMAALAPAEVDGHPDWQGYAKQAEALIATAAPREAADFHISTNPHLQRLKRESIELFNLIAAAIIQRSKGG